MAEPRHIKDLCNTSLPHYMYSPRLSNSMVMIDDTSFDIYMGIDEYHSQ
jgi:hypothetical protein